LGAASGASLHAPTDPWGPSHGFAQCKIRSRCPVRRRQLVEPVQWEATLVALARAPGNGPAAQLWELGPGAQIRAMVKRVDTAAWRAMKGVAA